MSPFDPEAVLRDPDGVSRRSVLRAAVAVGGSAGLAACLGDGEADVDAPTGGDPGALPERQHAWNDALPTDQDGNVQSPAHHVLCSLSLVDDGTVGPDGVDATARRRVETAFQSLERALEWSNEGLLFTVAHSPSYFERFDEPLPDSIDLPAPEPLTALENPEQLRLDDADALVHLASDDASVVLAAEAALLGERETLNGHELDATLSGVFERTRRRTGFLGPGLPAEKRAEHDGELRGMPQAELPEDAPFWMGFRAGFRESQATEDRVTLADGPFADGATQHVESLRLQLRAWFDQDTHTQRVEKMFSPAHAREESVGEIGERLGSVSGAADVADRTEEHARREGVVGHAQKAARAREDGEPLLLRRDFNAVIDEFPGVHFLSLQSSTSEFVRVREAVAGEDLTDAAVGRRANNGILEYLTVHSRGNYLVPPRRHRALPTSRPE